MSNVLVEESSLQAIANSIRAKNGSTDTYKPGDMATAIDEIEGGGLPKEFEWVNCISDGYDIVPDVTSIKDETVVFTYPSGNRFMFSAFPNYTLKHLTLNISKPLITCYKIFFSFGQVNANAGAFALEHLTINADTSKSINFGSFIRSCDIKVIDGTPLDFSSATTIGTFCNRCFGLAYIRIVPKTIKVSANFSGSYSWDNESLDSIFEGLADLTGSDTQTLTMNTKQRATIEANQNWLDKITGRNWTLAFVS